MKALLRPTKEMVDRAVDEAYRQLKEQEEDLIKRVVNWVLLAMALADLSPKTAAKVLRLYHETVRPMQARYVSDGVGDFGIILKLKEKGYPYLEPEREM